MKYNEFKKINLTRKNSFENGLEEEESVEQLKITLSSVKSNLNNTNRLKTLAYQMKIVCQLAQSCLPRPLSLRIAMASMISFS